MKRPNPFRYRRVFIPAGLAIIALQVASVPSVAPASVPDACALALLPGASGSAEARLASIRQQVRRAERPEPYLERLGWAYVAAARATNDPGLYTLARAVGVCLEARRPGSPEGLLLRSHVAHSVHRFKDAERLARALTGRRGLPEDYGVLGDALMEQGKLDDAIAAYQHMMDRKPGPQAYARAAHIRWLRGDVTGAIGLMEMAARASDPRDPDAAAWTWVRLSQYRLQTGDVARALHSTRAALALSPDFAAALLAHGRALVAVGDLRDAVAAMKRAAAYNPLPDVQWALADTLRAAGHENAARVTEDELRTRGAVNDPRTYAVYLATRGTDVDTALRLTQIELEVRGDVFSHDARAWALAAAGRLGEATTHMRQALSEGTVEARLFYHAAVIATRTGEHEAARHWMEKLHGIEHMLLPSERTQLADVIAASASSNRIETQP